MASAACMQLPPVTATGYTPQGRYEDVAGIHTYVVGPENPTRVIVLVYDIFGMAPQTLQGADRLSAHLTAAAPAPSVGGTLVLVPDFFGGAENAAQAAWFPPDDDDAKKAAIQKFMSERANFPVVVRQLLDVRRVIGEKYPAADEHVGVFGLCFGGKIAVLACGADNEGSGSGRRFVVSGTAHPGRLDVADAEALTSPHICLASPGEPADVVAQIKEVLEMKKGMGVVETYESMFHGWMGARANLEDENNRGEFERGYKQVAEFFAKYL
ncbi:dienelactone hydrolase family protein [Diplogelasinospora grovesii]|uniref:Dienelactone hydrolase family protein n=1 Tax=Diplogelasinospora grovesii TaxID=303347 RepID=A0AAN6S8R9_9PEZI|nr:dienelactone hydrolase family protein [Diplogelasinospora grovesii]